MTVFVFGDRACRELIKVIWDYKGRAQYDTREIAVFLPCEEIARKQPSASQDESSHWKMLLLDLVLILLVSVTEKMNSVVYVTQSMAFCYGSLS